MLSEENTPLNSKQPQQHLPKSKPNRLKNKKNTGFVLTLQQNELSTTRKIYKNQNRQFSQRNYRQNNEKLITTYITYLIYSP